MNWNLARAKNNLSELVRRAREDGPQEISIHGKAAVVILSVDDYRLLKDPRAPRDFKEWLLSIPALEDHEFPRRPDGHRPVDL